MRGPGAGDFGNTMKASGGGGAVAEKLAAAKTASKEKVRSVFLIGFKLAQFEDAGFQGAAHLLVRCPYHWLELEACLPVYRVEPPKEKAKCSSQRN